MRYREDTKKRVATMTFHMAHNYGAMLQAYALEKAINRLGVSCEILDYRFPYIDQWSGTRTHSELVQEFGPVKGNLKYWNRKFRGTYRNMAPARKKFDQFMRCDMKLSSNVFFNRESLSDAPYDAIVFGSDQIWNPELTNGFAPEYVGKYFDTGCTKLISYAASCGTDFIQPAWRNDFYPLLKRFSALGIREKGFTAFIEREYGLQAQTVLDPVFLLDRCDWDQIAGQADMKIGEPYLLIYAFETGDDIYQLARRIASERNLKLVTISYQKRDDLHDMLQLVDCGPKDFVALIRNASFVCTTSFHGMAFSIIYEKDFYCIGHPRYSRRNDDLLELINMQDRMFFQGDELPQTSNCNYTAGREILAREKERSLAFLRKNLT